MMATLKSEFRKLLSVRSTYFASLLVLLFIGFLSFYVEGYKSAAGGAASMRTGGAYAELILNVVGLTALVSAIIAVLYIVHEYRYNIINYTLTLSKSRTRVFVAKTIVILCYSFAFTIFSTVAALGFYRAGIAVSGGVLAAQHMDVVNIFGRAIFYVSGYALLGLLFGTLVRNIAFALAIIFVTPAAIEPLLGLLLKNNAIYLPFTVLGHVAQQGDNPGITTNISPGRAMVVFSIYLIIGWIVTWLLFLRRDAS